MFFPPSLFDIMVHLVVHLVREIRLCGPVYMRWMYPVERYMKILKGYVKNQCRLEASIIERYISEESIEFCSEYLSKAKSIGVPEKCWHSRRSIGRDFGSTSQCELYVEYNSLTQFVALGKCYEGVTMLNNVPLPSNFIKATVEKVLYDDVAVLVPTSEVTIVAEALHTFVA